MVQPIVLLDRDGTINVEKNYLADPDDLELIPDSAKAIARLNHSGAWSAVVTNQSGIARGLLTEVDLKRIHERLNAVLAEAGARLDGYYYCPHHPSDGCRCRKPEVGLLQQAATDAECEIGQVFMVGDKEADIAAGRSFGATTLLVRTGYGRETDQRSEVRADYVVDDLSAGVDLILGKLEILSE